MYFKESNILDFVRTNLPKDTLLHVRGIWKNNRANRNLSLKTVKMILSDNYSLCPII